MSNTTSPNESEIAGVEMPEPRAWLHRQGGCAEVSERQLDADEIARGWTQEPLFTADQLRQAVEAERALWQQDALRYRWLRANSTQPVEPWSTHSCPESLDDVVDAEMKNRPGPTR
jgi:hypothetical protein